MPRLVTGPVPQLSAGLDGVPPRPGPLRIVAWPHRYLTGRISGAEVMLHTLLRDSAARGHDVTVVAGSGSTRTIDGVKVVSSGRGRRTLTGADVVIGHLTWPRDLIREAVRQKLPVVYLIHNESETREQSWRLGDRAATVVVWNSEHIAAKGRDRWSGPSVIVRPPTLPADYPPAPAGTMATLVNAASEKGIHVGYRAAGKLPQHRFLVVAGGYGNQTKPPAGLKNVTWQAPTRNMARDVYARTRVLLMPSIRESWGKVAAEAVMSGIPVIAHPNDGLAEALGDDGAVWIDRANQSAWTRTVDLLMSDRAAWEERRAAADVRAQQLAQYAAADLDTWDDTLRRAASVTGRRGRTVTANQPRTRPTTTVRRRL